MCTTVRLSTLLSLIDFDTWLLRLGNGTQKAFLDDPSVLYISLHRYEGGSFYPGGPFGGADSCGEGVGKGT